MLGPAPVATRVVLKSMYDDETSWFGATIRILSMAVGLILVIACVVLACSAWRRASPRGSRPAAWHRSIPCRRCAPSSRGRA
jgi:hypothetical protein